MFVRKKLSNTKVICVGNITVGGTGKTSTVIYLAKELSKKGHNIVVLTGGYKKLNNKTEPIVVSDGKKMLLNVEQSGDEPYLIAKKLKTVPVIVGADRVRNGKFAVDRFHPDIILMDDGFQHLRLYRDLDIVLINCLDPFGKNYLLPLGLLREPLTAIRRAKIVGLTNSNFIDLPKLDFITKRIKNISNTITVTKTIHKPCSVRNFYTNEAIDLDWLRNRNVATLSAIGNPISFELTVESLGSRIVHRHRFLDHHWYKKTELETILKDTYPVVTTEKDAVRIKKMNSNPEHNVTKEFLSKLFILAAELKEEGILIDTVNKILENK